MTTIIAGSRGITDPEVIATAVAASGFVVTEVYSGGAHGVDTAGETWAKSQNIPVRVFPADWETFGKRAGMLRNETMASQADQLIAIWDGKSPGTKHMIAIAEEYGVPTFVYMTKRTPLAPLRKKT